VGSWVPAQAPTGPDPAPPVGPPRSTIMATQRALEAGLVAATVGQKVPADDAAPRGGVELGSGSRNYGPEAARES
jgi:hypothetical protein